jgi:hypothetical protein
VPGPPVAVLSGGREGPVTGDLGTFFWDGLGSDSPWIVSSQAMTVAPGGALAVTLNGAIAPERWTAAWAPVHGTTAADPTTTSEGTGGDVSLAAPVRPGTWSLLVEFHFPAGERAAFYWSVDVAQ